MGMTVQYFEVGGLAADIYADPLLQMLAEEGNEEEAEATYSTEVAYWLHVTRAPSYD